MKKVPIGDIAEINPRLPSTLVKQRDRIVDFVPMAQLSESGQVRTDQSKQLGEVAKGYTYFQNGDVIIAKITPCMENGKAAFVNTLKNGVAFGSTEFHVLRPNNHVIDGKYLFYMIWNRFFRTDAEGNMTGSAGQKRVPSKFLEKYEIPLPPLSEQKRIADILDKADAIRRKRQEAFWSADNLIYSAFQTRFGDPVTNTHGRKTVPLSAYGNITTGNTPPRKEVDNYGDAIEWIKSDNINTPSHWLTRATEGLSEKGLKLARTVPAGSTLVTCIAGSPSCVGNAAMTDRKVAFNQQINAITPNSSVDPYFLYTLILLSKPLVQRASTASMKGMVSKGSFEQVQVIKVDEDEQTEFGTVCLQILDLVNNHANAVKANGDLFDSLVQRAFNGEL